MMGREMQRMSEMELRRESRVSGGGRRDSHAKTGGSRISGFMLGGYMGSWGVGGPCGGDFSELTDTFKIPYSF